MLVDPSSSCAAMEFWGVEVKPKETFRLARSDYGGSRLHISQATLGRKPSKGERVVVKCRVGDSSSPSLYLCSFLAGISESCSLDLYFEDDIAISVKGSTSVHLVGYFEGSYEDDEPGEDVEDDGYSDEEDDDDEDGGSMDDFICDDDEEDDEDEELGEEEEDYSTAEETTDEEELIVLPKSQAKLKATHDKGPKKTGSDAKPTKEPGTAKETQKEISKSAVSDHIINSGHDDKNGVSVGKKRKIEAEVTRPTKKRSFESKPSPEELTKQPDNVQGTPTNGTDASPESAKKKKKKKHKKKKDMAQKQGTTDSECKRDDDGTPVKDQDGKSPLKSKSKKHSDAS